MSQNNQGGDQAARMAGLVGQIGCITALASLLVIGAAFAVGQFLDSTFDTEPVFTVLGLLGSFPITLYLIVRISLWALARAQQGIRAQQKPEETASKEEAAL